MSSTLPVWPSLVVASSLPAPGLCHVTGPSTSRSQLRSARRAGEGGKIIIRILQSVQSSQLKQQCGRLANIFEKVCIPEQYLGFYFKIVGGINHQRHILHENCMMSPTNS